MYADWIYSSNGLPRDGQQIEFVLDCRSVVMEGTYSHQAFHSHWAEYGADRVRNWRYLTQEGELATPTRNQSARVLSRAPRHDTSLRRLAAGGVSRAA